MNADPKRHSFMIWKEFDYKFTKSYNKIKREELLQVGIANHIKLKELQRKEDIAEVHNYTMDTHYELLEENLQRARRISIMFLKRRDQFNLLEAFSKWQSFMALTAKNSLHHKLALKL